MAHGCGYQPPASLELYLSFDNDRSIAPEYLDSVSGDYLAITSAVMSNFVFIPAAPELSVLHVPSNAPIESVASNHVRGFLCVLIDVPLDIHFFPLLSRYIQIVTAGPDLITIALPSDGNAQVIISSIPSLGTLKDVNGITIANDDLPYTTNAQVKYLAPVTAVAGDSVSFTYTYDTGQTSTVEVTNTKK
jgi:hypothetical protein